MTYVNSRNSRGHFIHVPSQSVHRKVNIHHPQQFRLPELSDIFSTSGALLRSCFRSHSTASLAFTRSCRAPVKLLTSETTRSGWINPVATSHFRTFSIGNDICSSSWDQAGFDLQIPDLRLPGTFFWRRDWTLDRICLTFSGSVTVWRASDVVTRNPGKLVIRL